MKKTKLYLLTLVSLASLLSGCVLFHGYAPDVQQGNAFTIDQVSKLRVGMPVNAVLAIMGSPVLVNTFNNNRFDYVYTFQKVGYRMSEKKVIVSFNRSIVTNIRTDLNPNMQPKMLMFHPNYQSHRPIL